MKLVIKILPDVIYVDVPDGITEAEAEDIAWREVEDRVDFTFSMRDDDA